MSLRMTTIPSSSTWRLKPYSTKGILSELLKSVEHQLQHKPEFQVAKMISFRGAFIDETCSSCSSILNLMKCGMCGVIPLEPQLMHACLGNPGHLLCINCISLYFPLVKSVQSKPVDDDDDNSDNEKKNDFVMLCPAAATSLKKKSKRHFCSAPIKEGNLGSLKGLYEDAVFECPFRSIGCKVTASTKSMADHAKCCIYRETSLCYFEDCTLGRIPHVNYSSHLIEVHKTPVIVGDAAAIIIRFNEFKGSKNKDCEGMLQVLVIIKIKKREIAIVLWENLDNYWIYPVFVDGIKNSVGEDPGLYCQFDISKKNYNEELGVWNLHRNMATERIISLEDSHMDYYDFNGQFTFPKSLIGNFFHYKEMGVWVLNVTITQYKKMATPAGIWSNISHQN